MKAVSDKLLTNVVKVLLGNPNKIVELKGENVSLKKGDIVYYKNMLYRMKEDANISLPNEKCSKISLNEELSLELIKKNSNWLKGYEYRTPIYDKTSFTDINSNAIFDEIYKGSSKYHKDPYNYMYELLTFNEDGDYILVLNYCLYKQNDTRNFYVHDENIESGTLAINNNGYIIEPFKKITYRPSYPNDYDTGFYPYVAKNVVFLNVKNKMITLNFLEIKSEIELKVLEYVNNDYMLKNKKLLCTVSYNNDIVFTDYNNYSFNQYRGLKRNYKVDYNTYNNRLYFNKMVHSDYYGGHFGYNDHLILYLFSYFVYKVR